MAESMLSQSQTHARDLAEQMGQRLKVTEAMLAEAVKARERLVADNESAVEGLLATVSSKDRLLKVNIWLCKYFIWDYFRETLSLEQYMMTGYRKHDSSKNKVNMQKKSEFEHWDRHIHYNVHDNYTDRSPKWHTYIQTVGKPHRLSLLSSFLSSSAGVCGALQPYAVWAHSRDPGAEKAAVWQAAAACHCWEAKLHNRPGGLFRDRGAPSPACWKRKHHQREFLWDTIQSLSCKMCPTSRLNEESK